MIRFQIYLFLSWLVRLSGLGIFLQTARSIPFRGTHMGCRPGPGWGRARGTRSMFTSTFLFISFSLPSPLLKINLNRMCLFLLKSFFFPCKHCHSCIMFFLFKGSRHPAVEFFRLFNLSIWLLFVLFRLFIFNVIINMIELKFHILLVVSSVLCSSSPSFSTFLCIELHNSDLILSHTVYLMSCSSF